MSNISILSALIFLPLLIALVIALSSWEGGKERIQQLRYITLATTVFIFILSLILWAQFDPQDAGYQFVEKASWLSGGIHYHLGVDGISILFIVLTAALMPLAIWGSQSIEKNVKNYMIAFLVLESLMIGVFCALDLVT